MSAICPISFGTMLALLASPALLMFLSTNVVNVGNFAFNLIFSRLMSPQEFADLTFVLTVKLVVLSVLTALQMAISQQVADGKGVTIAYLTQRPSLAFYPHRNLDRRLGLSGQPLGRGLAMIALACPFILPLVILRGLAMGHLDMVRTIASAQLEMVVRLGLSLLAWALGLGLVGIGAALALSLLAAWLPLRGQSETGEVASAWKPLALPLCPLQPCS